MFRIVAMATLCSVVPAGINAVEGAFSSGTAQTALIELFTSEGCSSCPPAEQWLAGRRADAGLWREFVPVAWHVTYWDQLGWADRFGQRAFTDRQYAYAAAWHSDSVYTPCFVRDGVEWRPGRAAGVGHPAGVLQARYDPQTGGLQVEFHPVVTSPGRAFDVHAVQLGGGLRSQVKSGENAGRTLEHEFVVLAVMHGEFTDQAGSHRVTLAFPLAAAPGVSRRALAVWVTRRGDLIPLQATGGWLQF